MKYMIYKWLGAEAPLEFDNLFFSPKIQEYVRFAGELIANDGEYRINGEDEELKRRLSDVLNKEPKNTLPLMRSGSNEKAGLDWTYDAYISFDDPLFPRALAYSLKDYFCYHPLMKFVKVNSLADVERVKREFEAVERVKREYEEENGLREAA